MQSQVVDGEKALQKFSKSYEMFEEAKKVIPGGVSANIKYFEPHPIVMDYAKGSKLVDVDGNEYIDYLLCYGALALGHGHPYVNEVTSKMINDLGTFIFGAPHQLEYDMAKKLVELFPSIDQVRFTNSGLEATLLCIRLAKAFTGKEKIAKFEGHYHGGYDEVLVSVNPNYDEAGDATNPKPVPESKGISKEDLENTIVLPFNNLDVTEKILRENKDEISAVILEPIQGGFIPATANFMYGLRKITEELGILLIFDEVKTGFRITVGGVQSIYHIEPDLTALGKVLGGGFPVGAVGGKKEIMEIMSPDRGHDILIASMKRNEKNDIMFHSGTYNGHPIVLAAGLATITVLEQDGMMDKLVSNTEKLRQELEMLYCKYSIDMQTIGMGSIFNIVLTDKKIKNYRDLKYANIGLRKEIDNELLKEGIYTKPMNRYSLSVAHTEEDFKKTVDAHENVLKKLFR